MSLVARVSQRAAATHGAAAFLLAEDINVAQALQHATGALDSTDTDTPHLDAEVLLAHVLSTSRSVLLTRLQDPLPVGATAAFAELVSRRLHHEPIAYLTHHKEFFGLDFFVDPRVLVPRPETELLVEKAITIHNSQSVLSPAEGFAIHNSQFCIADVGTGSGCIAVALAVHLPQVKVYATDVSPDALEVARINVARYRVEDRVHLVRGDLLHHLEPELRLDIIVANLPYVADSELAHLPRTVRDYEPVERALTAGPDGLALIRRLLRQAPARLNRAGVLLLEIGAEQGVVASELARRAFPNATVQVLRDPAGLDRVVEIQTGGERPPMFSAAAVTF